MMTPLNRSLKRFRPQTKYYYLVSKAEAKHSQAYFISVTHFAAQHKLRSFGFSLRG